MSIKKDLCSVKIVMFLCGISVFFLPPPVLEAKSKKKSEEKSAEFKIFYAKWKTNGAVKKLYKTPLGAVYQFTPTNPYSYAKYANKSPYDCPLNSIQFELYKTSKGRKKMKRFIIVDFKIRVFPAIAESKNPRLYFVRTRSMNGATSIKKWRNINGEAAYLNYSFLPMLRALRFIQAYEPKGTRRAKKTIKRKVKVKVEAQAWLGACFLPAYEVISMRTIIDTNMDGIISSNVNKALRWTLRKYSSDEKDYPVRSFGLYVTDIEVLKLGKSRRILEISTPKITLADNEADIQELPPIEFVEYPYEGYLTMLTKRKKKKNLKRLDNPDEIYGYALHLLKGKDLIEGVKLLTYIAKKKEHILAMNQLGICYWRGIGVKPDYERALVWFKRAGKYYLPDALAYGGALSLKRASKPYFREHVKRYIYYALNHNKLRKNGGKHSTSVLSVILNHALTGGRDEHERSAKLGYWIARCMINPYFYYKNSIYEDEGPRLKDEALTSGSEIPKYIKNKFYDIRKKYVGQWLRDYTMSKKIMNTAVEKDFPAAIYFKGQLLIAESKKEERESAVKKAMAIFKRGAKLGNLECAIELMHCKARLGLLKSEDFDTGTYVKFSDHPLYYLLKYIVKNPNAPGVKAFLNRDYREARRIWQKKTDSMSHFLLALEGIYQFYHYGADTAMYRMYYEHIYDIEVAYGHLNAAVKAKIQDAIYLKGVYYLNKKYNSPAGMRVGDISEGIELLGKLPLTNIKAQYYLIKNDFYNEKRMDKKWLKQLKSLRDLGFADAWILSSDILAKLHQNDVRKRKSIIAAYKKAAALGAFRAWDRIARLYYANAKKNYRNTKLNAKDKAHAKEYWKKF